MDSTWFNWSKVVQKSKFHPWDGPLWHHAALRATSGRVTGLCGKPSRLRKPKLWQEASQVSIHMYSLLFISSGERDRNTVQQVQLHQPSQLCTSLKIAFLMILMFLTASGFLRHRPVDMSQFLQLWKLPWKGHLKQNQTIRKKSDWKNWNGCSLKWGVAKHLKRSPESWNQTELMELQIRMADVIQSVLNQTIKIGDVQRNVTLEGE